MKIEKNAEGSYVLTCCDREIIALAESLLLYSEEVTSMAGITDPMFFTAHDYQRLTEEMGARLNALGRGAAIDKRCKRCLAPYDKGEKLCKK